MAGIARARRLELSRECIVAPGEFDVSRIMIDLSPRNGIFPSGTYLRQSTSSRPRWYPASMTAASSPVETLGSAWSGRELGDACRRSFGGDTPCYRGLSGVGCSHFRYLLWQVGASVEVQMQKDA